MTDLCVVPVAVRRCVDCGKRLARMNSGERCFACQQKLPSTRGVRYVAAMQEQKKPRQKPATVVRHGGGRRGPRVSDALRREIVAAAALASYTDLAARFGLAATTIGKIVRTANPNRMYCGGARRKERSA
jgi:hypothetical protein